jgi:PAS domain S-box-containing protein
MSLPAAQTTLIARSLVLAALVLTASSEAHAFGTLLANIGDLDIKRRLWLAAFGGLSIGLALGLLVFELRSRATAVAVRRMTDLAAGVDGRLPAESRRESVAIELSRLSDEILYTTQRVARDRREQAARLAGWEAMFAASLDATLALDAAGNIEQINPAAERLFRVKSDEAIGRAFVDVVLPPAHRSEDNACFARELASGKANGRRQELVAQRGDGRQFPVEVAIAQFNQGTAAAFIVTAQDISTQRRARAELARAREVMKRQTSAARSASATSSPAAAATTTAAGTPPTAGAAESSNAKPPLQISAHPFTIDATCGELVRKLAARAERRGLGFRYEDTEVQGLPLLGDASRLRRVLINLIDSVIKVAEAGEIVVHVIAVPCEARQVEVKVAVSATVMSDAQITRMVKPFVTESITRRENTAYPGRVTTERNIEFLGTRVALARRNGGLTLGFGQFFDADLSRVSIDLSSPRPTGQSTVRSTPQAMAAAAAEAQRAGVEFSRAVARLRRNAERANLIALWAEAHRLHTMWLRHGDPAEAGLVTALAHTARGGDATNAVLLARRFAEALHRTALRIRPETTAEASVAV